MASSYPPVKGVAFSWYFSIFDADGVVIASPAGLTGRTVNANDSAGATTDNSPTIIDSTGGCCRLILSATEMNSDYVWAKVHSTTSGAQDAVLTLYTAAQSLDTTDAVADAIKAKTDSLTFTVAGDVDCNVQTWKGSTAAAMTGDAYARIGAAGAGLTALPWPAAWDAEVQSECTDALNAYDPPTKAELDTAVANVSVDEIQASALADLFNTDSGTTYASAVAGSVVKEMADNAGGSALTVQAIVDGVWDEDIADHDDVGSTGEALAAAEAAGDPWASEEGIAVHAAVVTNAAGADIGADTTELLTRLPDATPGAAGGVLIAGTNAPVIIEAASGSALTLRSLGGGGSGLSCEGNGYGIMAAGQTVGLFAVGDTAGAHFSGDGGGNAGAGLIINPGSGSNEDAIEIIGDGSGSGVSITGGDTGSGVSIAGGAVSGDAVAITTSDGAGVSIDAAGDRGLYIVASGGNAVAISSDLGDESAAVAISGYAGLFVQGATGMGLQVQGNVEFEDTVSFGEFEVEDKAIGPYLLDTGLATDDADAEDARTVRSALRFLRNKFSVAGGVLTVTKENDSTTAWTAAVTTDGEADPVTGMDPTGP